MRRILVHAFPSVALNAPQAHPLHGPALPAPIQRQAGAMGRSVLDHDIDDTWRTLGLELVEGRQPVAQDGAGGR